VPVLIAGQIVILDNAAFHKSPRIRDSIEATGAKLVYLPPYSPDLNKIEPQWATLKARLRKDKRKYPEFLQNLDEQLKNM
jgi:transposase